MKYRKLRIAWSVAWGVAAVLLIVIWMQSDTRDDYIHFPLTSDRMISIRSAGIASAGRD